MNWKNLSDSVLRALILLAMAFGPAGGCTRGPSEEGGGAGGRLKRAVPVTVAQAGRRPVPIQLEAVGEVEAYSTVQVRAQVTGEITAVHFEEGQCVRTGDPLFTIDPKPYEALLKQMRANLAKNRVQLENALRQVKRNASVVEKGYVSQEQYDQAVTNAATLKAAVQADEAAVETVELQLKYCFIQSPVDGCTGALKLDRGNLVKANDTETPLVVINQVAPVYVAFDVPQGELGRLRRYMANATLAVEATPPGGEAVSPPGKLSFLDNTVNPATGTIRLKATFPNPDGALWPGQFVNVVLILTTEPNALVIPAAAVQTGQGGVYVYVVQPDLTVAYREIRLERSSGEEVVVSGGLVPGEKVVLDGQLRLAPGAGVKIVEKGSRASRGEGA